MSPPWVLIDIPREILALSAPRCCAFRARDALEIETEPKRAQRARTCAHAPIVTRDAMTRRGAPEILSTEFDIESRFSFCSSRRVYSIRYRAGEGPTSERRQPLPVTRLGHFLRDQRRPLPCRSPSTPSTLTRLRTRQSCALFLRNGRNAGRSAWKPKTPRPRMSLAFRSWRAWHAGNAGLSLALLRDSRLGMGFLVRRGKGPRRSTCSEQEETFAGEGRRAQPGVSLSRASRISWSKGKRSASVPSAATTLEHAVFLKPMVTSATRSLSHLSVAF